MPRPSAGPVNDPQTLAPTYSSEVAVPDNGHDLVARVAGAEAEWEDVESGDYAPADSHWIPIVKMGRKNDGTGGIAIGDGDAMVNEAQFVIAARGQSRIKFDGPYDSKDPKPPVCRSADGLTPDEAVVNKPSDKCKTCPWAFENMTERSLPNGEQRCQRNEEALVYLADTSAGLRVARIRFGGMAATTFRRYWDSFEYRLPKRPPISYVTSMELKPEKTDNGVFLVPAFERATSLSRADADIFINDRATRVDQWRTAIRSDNTAAVEVIDQGGPFDSPDDGGPPYTDDEDAETRRTYKHALEGTDPETGEIIATAAEGGEGHVTANTAEARRPEPTAPATTKPVPNVYDSDDEQPF